MLTKKDNKLALVVSHNIFLTDEQRNKVLVGDSVEIVGISLPVWFISPSGKTTEPATEIFCRYRINVGKKGGIVKSIKNGYSINIPSYKNGVTKIPNEEWRKLSIEEQETWYMENQQPSNVSNLKSIKEGGSEYLRLEEIKAVSLPWRPDNVTVLHCVEIKTIKDLEKSLVDELFC